MKKIDEFEEKHFALRPEYQVIGALMNKLKVAEGKDKFLLQVKLNRALKLAEARDAFDPNDPANYGIIERQDASAHADRDEDREQEDDFENREIEEFEGLEFDTLKQKDNVFVEKINAIDKKLEEKLAELAYTFGRKGKQLEEEIKDLAEERNTLIDENRQPLYRKVNTCISINLLPQLFVVPVKGYSVFQIFVIDVLLITICFCDAEYMYQLPDHVNEVSDSVFFLTVYTES